MHPLDLIAFVEAIIITCRGYENKRIRIDDLLYEYRNMLVMTRDVLTIEIRKMNGIILKLQPVTVSDKVYLDRIKRRLPLWKAIRTIVDEEIVMYRELFAKPVGICPVLPS